MKELIWEHTANGITAMWYRMKAWPHQQRRGFKYTIERVYINHSTGKIETSYHHTKN